MSPTARQELDKCYELLNTKADPFRLVWNECTIRDRNLFCHVAGVSPLLAKHPWDNLSEEYKSLIAKRVADLRRYLNDKAGAVDAAKP